METTKTLNEVLIRFNDDGEFQGAHVVYLYRTVDPDTGKQVTASLGTPQSIAKASDADRAKIVAVIGEAVVAITEAHATAVADAQDKAQALDAKATELADKESELAQAIVAKDEAEKRAAEYAAELAALKLAEPVPTDEGAGEPA